MSEVSCDPGRFNPLWEEEIYKHRPQPGKYPYDAVVTFVFRNAPKDRPRDRVSILEVGCGGGNNLWFAAREGFCVSGIDGSATAIEFAKKRFADEGLAGRFEVGDFCSLPFSDGEFDLAIDRAALCCVGRTAAARAVGEVGRVLKAGGVFFCNTYADSHTSCVSGVPGEDGMTVVSKGTVAGVGPLCFYSQSEMQELFTVGWEIRQMEELRIEDRQNAGRGLHSEWRVIAAKK